MEENKSNNDDLDAGVEENMAYKKRGKRIVKYHKKKGTISKSRAKRAVKKLPRRRR